MPQTQRVAYESLLGLLRLYCSGLAPLFQDKRQENPEDQECHDMVRNGLEEFMASIPDAVTAPELQYVHELYEITHGGSVSTAASQDQKLAGDEAAQG